MKINKRASLPKLITVIALLAGFVAYQVIQKLIDQFLYKIMNLKRIPAKDEFFLIERNGTTNTTGLIIEMDPLKFENFRHWVRQVHAEKFPMARAKIIQFLGNFYYK